MGRCALSRLRPTTLTLCFPPNQRREGGMALISYSEIEFGKARAELEAARYPQLLEQGYLDYQNAYSKLESGEYYLVLGQKGAGKSAIGEKLRLDAERDRKRRVAISHLGDFPFKPFSKILGGSSEAESSYPSTWSWLLLLAIVDNLRSDPGARDALNIDHNKAIQELCDLGLLPATDLKRVVLQSSKTTFKASIPKILEYTKETAPSGSDLQFLALVDYLKGLVVEYSTEGGLILVIDGLDDVLTKREVQYQALSALVFEVDRLNMHFFRSKKPIHIVLLCRTELFERLPGPNKNKLRQDSALELNWYHDTNSPGNSRLVELVNLRASLSAGEDVDVFGRWFPEKFNGGSTVHFLLDNTRHTPRDFINLMNSFKEFCSDQRMTKEQVLGGLRKYSIEYFEPEIRDELVGYVAEDSFDKFCELVAIIRQREFSYERISKLAAENGFSGEQLSETLRTLYDCGAIGNKWGTPSGSSRYEFKYRNKNASFDRSKTIVLHRGLWKALNLI